mgnify:CR=1 FL=1
MQKGAESECKHYTEEEREGFRGHVSMSQNTHFSPYSHQPKVLEISQLYTISLTTLRHARPFFTSTHHRNQSFIITYSDHLAYPRQASFKPKSAAK